MQKRERLVCGRDGARDAQRDGDHTRRAKRACRLELFGRQTAGFFDVTEALESKRGARAPVARSRTVEREAGPFPVLTADVLEVRKGLQWAILGKAQSSSGRECRDTSEMWWPFSGRHV